MTQKELIINWSDKILNHFLKLKVEKYPDLTFWLRVDSQQNQTKREYLNEWINAVNNHSGFGKWHWDVSFHPSDLEGLIKKCIDKELA